MKPVLPSILAGAAVALVSGVLPAQTSTPVLKADSAVNVYANKVTKGTSTFGRWGLRVSAYSSPASASTSARFGKSWFGSRYYASVGEAGGIGGFWRRSTTGGDAGTGKSATSVETHSFTYTIPNAAGGTLTIYQSGSSYTRTGTKATIAANSSVKVGSGTPTTWKAGDKTLKTTVSGITATSLTVKIATSGSVSQTTAGYSRYSAGVTVYFEPKTTKTTCTITAGTASCKAGGALTATVAAGWGNTHRITTKLAGAALKKSIGILVLSSTKDTSKLGTSGCVILSKGFFGGIFFTDANGNATDRFSVPNNRPVTLYGQDVTLGFTGGLRVNTSNTLGVSCK